MTASDVPATATRVPLEVIAFEVEGMTCASCVNRIERYLNKVEGVGEASVNLATERATVRYDSSLVAVPDLVTAVERAGYAVRPEPAAPASDRAGEGKATGDVRERERETELEDLRSKSFVSLGVGLGMMAVMYLPLSLDMALVAPFLLIAATVIQFWAGSVFYRAAWAAGRRPRELRQHHSTRRRARWPADRSRRIERRSGGGDLHRGGCRLLRDSRHSHPAGTRLLSR